MVLVLGWCWGCVVCVSSAVSWCGLIEMDGRVAQSQSALQNFDA